MFSMMQFRRQCCNLQHFPLKLLHIVSQVCQWLLTAYKRQVISCLLRKWTSREDKAFVLLNEPQEPCWVYFSWVYIRSDFGWFLHFSAFWLSLPAVPVGEDCVLRFSEPECYSCRLFIPVPSLQAISHLCVLVFTPSHALILQTALSIFEISFL